MWLHSALPSLCYHCCSGASEKGLCSRKVSDPCPHSPVAQARTSPREPHDSACGQRLVRSRALTQANEAQTVLPWTQIQPGLLRGLLPHAFMGRWPTCHVPARKDSRPPETRAASYQPGFWRIQVGQGQRKPLLLGEEEGAAGLKGEG